MPESREFRIRFDPIPGRRPDKLGQKPYRVTAGGPSTGDFPGEFRLPMAQSEVENFIYRIAPTSAGGLRGLDSPEWDRTKVFGARLFKALFTDEIRTAYTGLINSLGPGDTVRVTLDLTRAPGLGLVPWEFLFDGTNFVSLAPATSIVRFPSVPKPQHPLAISLPLRILAVASVPSDAEPLATQQERADLTAALAPLEEQNAVVVDWLEQPTLEDLRVRLQPDTYHILHFIGHGGFDESSHAGALLFSGGNGQRHTVSGERLGMLVQDLDSLRLVFLNSCETAKNDLRDTFSGVAGQLLEHEVPAVIAMQFKITDHAAIRFASAFYAGLAEGDAIERAVTDARRKVWTEPNDVEWGTPILFLRTGDGRLFDLAEAAHDLPRVAPTGSMPATAAAPAPVAATAPAVTAPMPALGEPLPAPGIAAEPAPAVTAERARTVAAEPARAVAAEPAPVVAAAPATLLADSPVPTMADVGAVAGMPAVAGAPPVAVPPAVPSTGGLWGWIRGHRAMTSLAVLVLAVSVVAAAVFLANRRPEAGIYIDLLVPAENAGPTPGHVVVTGFGFDPGESVAYGMNGTLVDSVDADSTGGFQVDLDIGDRESVVVEAIGGQSGRHGHAEFDYATAFQDATGGETPTPEPTGGTSTPEPTESPASSDNGQNQPPVTIDWANQILFYSNWQDGSTDTDYELYAIDPDTRVVTQLTDNGAVTPQSRVDDVFPTWNPEHTMIAYAVAVPGSSGAAGQRDIWIRDLDGNAHPLFESSETDDFFPAWGPNDRIAFVQTPAGETSPSKIVWMPADGSAQPETMHEGHVVRGPAWSAAGDQLAWFEDVPSGGPYQIFTSRSETDFGQLDTGQTWNLNPTWSPDGTRLAYVDSDGRRVSADIWWIDVATGGKKHINPAGDTVQDGNPVWSPDGRRIAFYRQSSDGFHIWVVNANGTGATDLMPGRHGNNLDPNWR